MDVEEGNNFLAALDNIDEAVIAFDNKLHYTYINKRGLELINKKKEEVIGKNIEDVFPGVKYTESGKHFYRVIKTRKPIFWEYYSEGKKQWLKGRAYHTNDGIVVFYTDVTERHFLEDSLQEKTRLLELSFDAIQIEDEQNKILYWNKGAEIIYGWKEEEVIGKIGYQLLGIQFPGGYDRFFRQLRKTKHWKGILNYITKDKKQIIVESTWALLEKNGKEQILQINHDITEQTLIKKQLALSEKKIRSMIENSSDIIVISDGEMHVQYISGAVKRVLGYSSEDFHKLSLDKIVHPEDIHLLTALSKGLQKHKFITGVFRVKTKRGQWKWVETYSHNLLDEPAVQGVVSNVRDITETKKAEQKVEESESKFRALIENSSDVTLITNAKGKITYISPSIKKIFGYSPEDLIKSPPKLVFHPDDIEKTMANLHKLLSGYTNRTSGEYRIKNKKGEWRWIHTEATNLLNDSIVQGIVSNVRDITDEKLYQEKIENQTKKITEILEHFSYGYYALDKDWKYLYINKEGEKLSRVKREDILGKSVWDIFPDVETNETGNAMKQVMKERHPMKVIQYYPPYNMWYENYIYPTIEGIAIYSRNITEEKNIQQEIFDTEQELEAILKNIPNGVMVQDTEGSLVYVNNEAAKLTGYSSIDEMLKAPKLDYIYKFDLRNEYGKKFLVENLPGRIALQTGKNAQATVKFIHKRTGEVRWLTITSTVIYRGRERKPLVVNVMQDISELKEADVRKNDFISMASHELKTPLTSLKVYMHLLTEKQKINENKKKEYIVKASDQVEKLQQLVSELLDQSTIQQGRLSLHLQEMYFDYFVQEFINHYQEVVKGFTFTVTGKTNSLVKIDKYRIEQVLANLLSNAVKYSADKKEVVIKLLKGESSVYLSVTDFGMGIPSTELESIFKPYYRVIGKKENTFPGMGMGLYITKDIVIKHGGNITAESIPGQGTTFTVSLPIAD